MSKELSMMLAEEFSLSDQQSAVIVAPVRNLDRKQRKILFEQIKPKQRQMRVFLEEKYHLLSDEQRQQWVDATVESIFNNGGEPDTVDSIMMDIVGRIDILHRVKNRSIVYRKPLKAMSGMGSFTFFIIILAAITAVVLLVINI